MCCNKINRRSCLYYQRIVFSVEMRLAIWTIGYNTISKEKGCGYGLRAEQYFIQMFRYSTFANFLKTIIIPKCKKNYRCMPWELNPESQEQDMRSPTNSVTSATSLLHGQSVDYIYMSLWLILLECKWMRLNQHDRIRPCSQKFATWKSLRLRSKNTS